MKDNTHPDYQEVLFVDSSTGHKFVIGSTMKPEARETYEGKEYPVCYVTTSSASHPFFTGSNALIDTEGRVDKFKKRYQKKAAAGVAGPTKEDPLKKKVKSEK